MGRWSCFLACLVAAPTLGALFLVGQSGCIAVDPDAADSGASASSSTTVGDAGTACSEDPATGVTLCADISTCPTVSVNQATLPGCGYLVQADPTVLDLECTCGTYLCPIGVAAACTQAASLLSGLAYATVCAQSSEGLCVQEAAPVVATAPTATSTPSTSPTTPTTTGTASPTTTTCNTQCIVNCGDAPDCQLLCGC
jgi:hypothetical protein